MKTHPLYQSPRYDDNENIRKKGYNERCISCNKPMRQQDIKYYVHMTTDWVAIDSENLSLMSKLGYSSQGYFPIGGECRKNMPPEFIFKRMK